MKNLIKFNVQEYLDEQLKDPGFKVEWEKLEPEYQLMREIIKARKEKHLNQKQLAAKADTTQAKISKIEAGLSNPTIQTMNKIATAFGKKLQIRFVSPV